MAEKEKGDPMRVELKVDDKSVELKGFPKAVLFEVFAGILRTLRDVNTENWQKAEIFIEK